MRCGVVICNSGFEMFCECFGAVFCPVFVVVVVYQKVMVLIAVTI